MNDLFAQRADEFIARIRESGLGPSTEVTLIYQCDDETGQPLEALGIPLEGSIRVSGLPNRQMAEVAATDALTEAIAAIESAVRRAPNYPVVISGGYSFPVLIRDFELDISEPFERR